MKASASNLQTQDEEYAGEAGRPDWKAELNAKLAEHRQRRAAAGHWSDDAPGAAQTGQTEALGRETTAARVAARVAARYAQAPSYSELLAASAAAAAEAAVAAEHAAIAAREANEAAEIFFAETAQAEAQMRERAEHGAAMAVVSPIRRAELEGAQGQLAGMGLEARDAYPEQFDLAAAATGDRRIDATVQHPEPLPARTVVPERPATSEAWSFPASGVRGIVDAMAEAIVPPARSLPAKLIEFPRELIASRKARPRIAEGPLLEERGGELVPVPGSLRIFEVADRDGASGPVSASRLFEHGSEGGSARRETGRAQAAEEGSGWQSIRLGEHPGAEGEGVEGAKQAAYRHAASSAPALTRAAASHAALQTASIGDRVMAALVDGALVGMAFLTFVLVCASCSTHVVLDKLTLAAGAGVLGGFLLLYQWLFMHYAGGTPGMRYARIALCTFEDENPTREVCERRVLAGVLAALPAGLGLAWAIFDEDKLGWHDRMTRSYQRSYRD